MSDVAHLTAAMAAGDSQAVTVFYRGYFDWMYTQARLSTARDESFCLDVVQEATLRVIRSIKPVDSKARLRAWLRLVVQTTALDLLRRERRLKARENAVASILKSQISDSPAPNEYQDWLTEQLSKLDPAMLKMIELRFEQRWTLRRIGQLLGMTTSAVDGRLRRVLKDLRKAANVTTRFDLEDESAMHDDTM